VSSEVELSDGTSTTIDSDELLVATGRRPNTADIGLATVGLEPGSYLGVDDTLSVEGVEGDWLFAVGDVNGRALLTHVGKYQARILGARLSGVDTRSWGDRVATPRVVFTSPEVAAVGLTEADARERGIEVLTTEFDFGSLAASAVQGRGSNGTAKIVVDADRDVIVGATFVGPKVAELLHSATIAIVGEITLDTLWHAIPSFPTLSEIWLRLLETHRDEHGAVFV
jgi:dihydrolipoamide dehydrogenase